MIGYKATDKDGCCRGFKFEIGKTYTKGTSKEVYRLGFSEPHTSDEQPCRNSGVFDGTCNADMNEWNY